MVQSQWTLRLMSLLLLLTGSILCGAFGAFLLSFLYSLLEMGWIGSLAWMLMIPIIVWSSTKLVLLLAPLMIITVYTLQYYQRKPNWYLVLPLLYALSFGLYYTFQLDWFLSLIITVYYSLFSLSFSFLWYKLFIEPNENLCKSLFALILPLPFYQQQKTTRSN